MYLGREFFAARKADMSGGSSEVHSSSKTLALNVEILPCTLQYLGNATDGWKSWQGRKTSWPPKKSGG